MGRHKSDLQFIYEKVEKATGKTISKRNRRRPLVYSRYVYFLLAKKLTEESLEKIGKKCGRRDHATVLHGIKKFDELIACRDFVEIYNKCAVEINNTNAFVWIDLLESPEKDFNKFNEKPETRNGYLKILEDCF